MHGPSFTALHSGHSGSGIDEPSQDAGVVALHHDEVVASVVAAAAEARRIV